MKIIENPNTKLESVDLIDDNGVLLRITPESLVSVESVLSSADGQIEKICLDYGWIKRRVTDTLKVTVKFLGRDLDLYFTGEEAVKITQSLYKLKGC